jgi:uncharacterized membrane protein YeaQ/YmgE (transglycosylase-associated protein family)
MNLLVWLAAGAGSGAIACVLLRISNNTELTINIVAGMVGAVLGGTLLAPVFGSGEIDLHHYTSAKLTVALFWATTMIVIVNLFSSLDPR